MKIHQPGFRLVLGTLFLLAAAAPGSATVAASAALPPTIGPGGDLLAFQRVTPGSGWALVGQQLFWTDSGGTQWRDMTPPGLAGGAIRAASFADTAHGWVVSTAPAGNGDLSYELARTTDGGQSWERWTLALFAPGEAASMAGEVFLQFIDGRTGWLVAKLATSPNFSLGTLFKTSDGGDHWTRLSLPIGAPVQFTNARDGMIEASAAGNGRYVTHDGGQTWAAQAGAGAPSARGPSGEALSALSMATARAGWAKSAAGQCDAGACVLVTKLLGTTDGGQTWSPVSLPGGRAALERTIAAPNAAPGQSAGGLRVIYDGHGFDSCKNDGSLPALGDMQTWYSNGPYGVWNLYIGGSSRADCGNLTRAYLQQLAQQGWLFIPTWVGPQAPCSSLHTPLMSDDPSTAYNQGVAEAFLARNVAKNLGLTFGDLSGTVIYYDVEYYRDTSSDQACLQAVKSFISGWSGELRATGDLAGVYGAPCGQSLSEFANMANVPDLIWIAAWGFPGYEPSASVWWQGCGLGNSLWTNNQRLRQYAGGHTESWSGVDFNIDSDRIVGQVATVTDACAPAAYEAALFVYPNFGGQCVIKSLGSYPTTAAIGLPAQSISSLRVSSGVTVTLCQGESHAPACSVFTTDQTDLSNTAVGDNQASSAFILDSRKNHVYSPLMIVDGALPSSP